MYNIGQIQKILTYKAYAWNIGQVYTTIFNFIINTLYKAKYRIKNKTFMSLGLQTQTSFDWEQ